LLILTHTLADRERKKERRLALILHSAFYHEFKEQGVTAYILTHEELENRFSNDAHASYMSKYLLGYPGFEGVVEAYRQNGFHITVYEERYFQDEIEWRPESYAFDCYDFQFAASLSANFIKDLAQRGIAVSGWCIPRLGNKALQAKYLSRVLGMRASIPRQLHVSRESALQEIAATTIDRYFNEPYLIVKSFFGSRSRMVDGSDYVLFHKHHWKTFCGYAKDHPAWFAGEHGIVVSELVQTHDPYLGNNNAVWHKVHLPGGMPEKTYRDWPLKCNRISARYHVDRIGSGVKPIGGILETFSWDVGDLERYRGKLVAMIQDYSPTPCLFGLDVMIKPNGELQLLEINKIAGTYSDPLGRDNHSVLQEYMETVLHWLNEKTDQGLQMMVVKNQTALMQQDVEWSHQE
jgi:hypothetical protein